MNIKILQDIPNGRGKNIAEIKYVFLDMITLEMLLISTDIGYRKDFVNKILIMIYLKINVGRKFIYFVCATVLASHLYLMIQTLKIGKRIHRKMNRADKVTVP